MNRVLILGPLTASARARVERSCGIPAGGLARSFDLAELPAYTRPHARAVAPDLAGRRVLLVGWAAMGAFEWDTEHAPALLRWTSVVARYGSGVVPAVASFGAAVVPSPRGPWWRDPSNVAEVRKFLLAVRQRGVACAA